MKLLRTTAFGGVGAGVLATVMLGGGLIALLSDSFVFADNQFQSTEFVEGQLDLQLALSGEAADCNDEALSFTSGPITGLLTDAALDFSDDLNSAAPYTSRVIRTVEVCVRNGSDFDGRLGHFVDTNLLSQELPDCSAREQQDDPSCDEAGDPGELEVVLAMELSFEDVNTIGPSCSSVHDEAPESATQPSGSILSLRGAPAFGDEIIPANTTCGLRFRVAVRYPTQELHWAVTDQLQFDYHLLLQDASV